MVNQLGVRVAARHARLHTDSKIYSTVHLTDSGWEKSEGSTKAESGTEYKHAKDDLCTCVCMYMVCAWMAIRLLVD
jgi:hypothetical protein